MIRVVVAGRSERLRSGVRMRLGLESDMSVIADVDSVCDALALLTADSVDVLLVDVTDTSVCCEDLGTGLQRAQQVCAVVALSTDRTASLCTTAADVECVSLYDSEGVLVNALRLAHSRFPHLSQEELT